MSRITPALAGTTLFLGLLNLLLEDHPRACGDYQISNEHTSGKSGSPPRLRGLLVQIILRWVKARITPALAGTTLFPFPLFCAIKDHPRACGDYIVG